MNGLNLVKRTRMEVIMHYNLTKEKPLAETSDFSNSNLNGGCIFNTNNHTTAKSKVQTSFEVTLVRYQIPFPKYLLQLNAFLRWGKNNRYWAYRSDIGYSVGDWVLGTKEFVFCPIDEFLQCNSSIIQQHFETLARAQEESYCKVAQSAKKIWNQAYSCLTHPYLEKKQILPHRIKVNAQNNLIIPLLSVDGRINSLQYIDSIGNKRFLSGGKKKGCYFPIGNLHNRILLSEGFATAASIHQATNELTLCCFDAGNIPPTATALRNKYPDIEIVICADNDQYSTVNTGLLKAIEAGNQIKAKVVYPIFQSLENKPTDFNDLYCLEGIEVVKKQILNAFMGGNNYGK